MRLLWRGVNIRDRRSLHFSFSSFRYFHGLNFRSLLSVRCDFRQCGLGPLALRE